MKSQPMHVNWRYQRDRNPAPTLRLTRKAPRATQVRPPRLYMQPDENPFPDPLEWPSPPSNKPPASKRWKRRGVCPVCFLTRSDNFACDCTDPDISNYAPPSDYPPE